MRIGSLDYRVDNQIRASEVRVIGADGKQLGILKAGEALERARKEGLSLVEIAPNANPPVAKIVELGKFKYQEEKKARESQKKAKGGEVKEIRFSPFIAENDYNIRLTKVKKFLGEKNKVRLVVVFRGPQLRSKKFGYDLLARILREVEVPITIDMEPKFLGKHLMMIISPSTKKVVLEENKDAKNEN